MEHAAPLLLNRLALSATVHCLTGCGIGLRKAVAIALGADTVSITIMEIVDNLIMLVIPGAMEAGSMHPLFWGSLALALLVAGLAAFP